MQKIILQFLKNHWKEVALVVLSAIVIGKMQYDMNELQKVYAAARVSYEEQIVGLQKIHDQELEERERALEQYEKEMARIEREYRKGLQEAQRKADRDERTFERNHTEAPAELIAEIENQFGFEYVEAE